MVQNLPVQVWWFVWIFFFFFFFYFLREVWERWFVYWFGVFLNKSFKVFHGVLIYLCIQSLWASFTPINYPFYFCLSFFRCWRFFLYGKTDCQVALSYRNISVILPVMWIVSYEELSLLSYKRVYLYLLLWFSPDIWALVWVVFLGMGMCFMMSFVCM